MVSVIIIIIILLLLLLVLKTKRRNKDTHYLFMSHSQKSATFRVDKSAQNVKQYWVQKREKPI